MRNPTYAGEFAPEPMPEKMTAVSMLHFDAARPILSMGIKTITHNRDGLKLYPHEVVAVEIREGDELASFDLNPPAARHYAERLVEYAARIEKKVL